MPTVGRADFVSALDALIARGSALITALNPEPSSAEYYAAVAAFTAWYTQVTHRLDVFLGSDHLYVTQFANQTDIMGMSWSIKCQRTVEMLKVIREDADADLLRSARALIAGEVFEDFLSMAEHLLQEGYKDPAAMLSGAVLEDGLRRIATTIDPSVTGNLNALNNFCHQKQVYARLQWRTVQVWGDIRNSADHGQFSDYSEADVRNMLSGVRGFLAGYLK